MELRDLGLDDWFQQQLAESGPLQWDLARVAAVDRERYLVRNETGEVQAELAGRLLFAAESSVDLPAVGDWACVHYHNDRTLAIVEDLLPRRSSLKRKTPGKQIDHQMIGANIDTAFIMQSCDTDFNLRRLERYLVMALDGNIHPALLLSKSDLVSDEDLAQQIDAVRNANIDCAVVGFSNATGHGLDGVEQMLERGRTYCLLGSSGVGKTTLLNHLLGRDTFDTNVVREKDGKGRHTTTRRQLVMLGQGAMLIDTPGMRELANIGVDTAIDESFAEIRDLAGGCRFNDCGHTNEVGCAVLAAVEEGTLSEARYQSYLKLRRESEHYEMSYVEQRRKDRQFGQFIKSVKKDLRKR